MKAEDRNLLLKDLCARLPYKVMIQSVGENKCLGLMDLADIDSLPKPYLRPMSSMTEEEYNDMFNQLYLAQEEFFRNCSNTDTIGKFIGNDMVKYDWLNEHHFDYRGLIDKGLALEAPEGMLKKGE